MATKNIAVLAGDGIGPEIMAEGIKVLDAISEKYGHRFNWRETLVGGSAYDVHKHPLPADTTGICDDSDAIYFGAVGGEKWASLPKHLTPERGALLPLRKRYDLFANFRPAMIFPPLMKATSLKEDRLKGGLDILIVRELAGGIYYGNQKVKSITLEYNGKEFTIKPGRTEIDGVRISTDMLFYSEPEIERITRVAADAAMKRNKNLVSFDKENVLDTYDLWREIVNEVKVDYPELSVDHHYVDNGMMQIVTYPTQYDVIVAGNMFGDISSDVAAAITGSIGMLPSASMNDKGFGLFEPVHGSAPTIAGKGWANPLAQILSGSMMLRYSFGLIEEANDIDRAVGAVLEKGFRTRDILGENEQRDESLRLINTSEMGDMVVEEIGTEL